LEDVQKNSSLSFKEGVNMKKALVAKTAEFDESQQKNAKLSEEIAILMQSMKKLQQDIKTMTEQLALHKKLNDEITETNAEWRKHYKSEIEETMVIVMKRIDDLTTKNMTYSNEINRLNEVAIENQENFNKEKKSLVDENNFVKKDNMKISEKKSGAIKKFR